MQRASRHASQFGRTHITKSVLFATCAAIIVAAGAFGASAGQFTAKPAAVRVLSCASDGNRYYGDSYYYDSGYPDRGYYDDSQRGWSDNGYGNREMVSPRWIVRNLQRSDYRYISRPVLSGRFYQVKAVIPNGKKVKLTKTVVASCRFTRYHALSRNSLASGAASLRISAACGIEKPSSDVSSSI